MSLESRIHGENMQTPHRRVTDDSGFHRSSHRCEPSLQTRGDAPPTVSKSQAAMKDGEVWLQTSVHEKKNTFN